MRNYPIELASLLTHQNENIRKISQYLTTLRYPFKVLNREDRVMGFLYIEYMIQIPKFPIYWVISGTDAYIDCYVELQDRNQIIKSYAIEQLKEAFNLEIQLKEFQILTKKNK